MSSVVLDASAILALINAEPGAERLTPDLLSDAICSTVNLAEVQAKLVARGWPPDDAWLDATSAIREAVPFSEHHAKIAGSMVAITRQFGLSLGDRACIALGMALGAPVFTTEKAWNKLKLGVHIRCMRP